MTIKSSIMNEGIIRVYRGTRPDSPNDPPGASELAQITAEDGSGLLLTETYSEILANDGTWRLRANDSGTAQWWCWCFWFPIISYGYMQEID